MNRVFNKSYRVKKTNMNFELRKTEVFFFFFNPSKKKIRFSEGILASISISKYGFGNIL